MMMSSKNIKCCVDCKTTKTPLWRGGPAGPKSLCNACGIKHMKRRRAGMALKEASMNKKKKNGSTNLKDSSKIRLLVLGKDFNLQRLMASSVVKKQRWQRRRKLCEEELAAVTLLALSCSSVYA